MSSSSSAPFLTSLRDAKVLIFGAGVTGAPTEEFLTEYGAQVTVLDEKKSGSGISNSLPDLQGGKFDLAVVSPGWKLDHLWITSVKSAGIPVLSEIDLAWRAKQELCPNQRWIGLTGTNGKTTAVQMAEAIALSANIKSQACGNVGTTVIEAVSAAEADLLILELSSFQLDWSEEFQLESAAILNIAADHIDWHGSFDAYASAKFRIASRTKKLILNASDPEITKRALHVAVPITSFSLETPAPHQIGLVENLIVDRAFISGDAEALFELADVKPAAPHNVLNAMAAAALIRSIGAPAENIGPALRNFVLDHHRLEIVGEFDGTTWIDDSKATNPHAALAALQSQLSAIWIAGGLAKGAQMDELVKKVGSRIKAAIMIGTDAPIIEGALREHAPQVQRHMMEPSLKGAALMKEVVACAKKIAGPGDTVLLAPACASMDQFKNYAERGELFAAAVREAHNAK